MPAAVRPTGFLLFGMERLSVTVLRIAVIERLKVYRTERFAHICAAKPAVMLLQERSSRFLFTYPRVFGIEAE